LPHHGGERDRIGADDLGGAKRLPRQHQLVAGGEQREARPPAHRQPGVIERGRKADVTRGEAPPRRQRVLVAPKIQPDRTHESPRLDRSFDLHAITFGARVLLERDGVCSPGQQAAREDAHGLAWPELLVVGAARGRAADQAQSSMARHQIGRAHRVAIHRRGVAGRLVA
jgi:hypothetical protein